MNGAISTRTAALLAAVIPAGIALIVAVVLLVAPAAHASPADAPVNPVQFSTDGIVWSSSYTGALFAGVLLVPGGSAERSFYVRNGAAEPAQLRVTLYDVATTDVDLAAATSISTSTPTLAGATVALTDAHPCATLSQGQVLPAGGSVRLDNLAQFADMNGTSGQGHQVSFKLAISLSSTDAAAPAPDTCPTDFDSIVVGSSGPTAGTPSHPVYHLGAGGWTPVPAVGSTPAPTPSATPTSPATPTGNGPDLGTLVGNTQRFYQEDTVALWLAMAALGGFLLVVWRRRRRHADPTLEYPDTHNKIGVGR